MLGTQTHQILGTQLLQLTATGQGADGRACAGERAPPAGSRLLHAADFLGWFVLTERIWGSE